MPYVINAAGADLANWGRGLGETLSQSLVNAPIQRQQQLMQFAQIISQRQAQAASQGFEQQRIGEEQKRTKTEQERADTAKSSAQSEADYKTTMGKAATKRAEGFDQSLKIRTDASRREGSLATEIAKLRIENAHLRTSLPKTQQAGVDVQGLGHVNLGTAGNIIDKSQLGDTNLAPVAQAIQQALAQAMQQSGQQAQGQPMPQQAHIAINPQTRQKVQWNGSQWIPIQ